MDELKDLLQSSWGAEKWIAEGWEQITDKEKKQIRGRMKAMFRNGLPFEVKKDKLLYIYTFSMLAQLETLAIQIPLKFEDKMTTIAFKQRMRTQLLDEIFHSLVFTKIVYLLCEPYAFPPAYNKSIEAFCDFIRNEDCPKVAVVLLNLIAEGWIEELFCSLRQQNIANDVFDIILEDEHRHVCEADLYREIGLPSMEIVKPKLDHMEEQLLTNVFFQHKYVMSLRALLGKEGTRNYIVAINKKHIRQLNKIGLMPGKKWLLYMQIHHGMVQYIEKNFSPRRALEMTPMRKVLMNMWGDPRDPTMVSQFNIDITCLDVFNKKFPPETITMLMLQAVSQCLLDNSDHLPFLVHKEFYQSQTRYVSLVVKLPNCGDHFGTIVFLNSHNMTPSELFFQVRQNIRLMVYCYKKREQMEKDHPNLKQLSDKTYADFIAAIYPYPELENLAVSLTNLGGFGYTHVKSPLLKNEALKFTLLDVERKQVWNNESKMFEMRDLLPVSISVDHRVADGNVPIAKMIRNTFETMFQRMENSPSIPAKFEFKYKQIIAMVDNFLGQDLSETELNIAYGMLCFLQTSWPAFLPIDELFEISKSQMVMLRAENYFKNFTNSNELTTETN